MRRLTDTLAALEANVKHLTRHAPTAERNIRAAVAVHDGYPSATSTAREPGSGELTSVEAAAERRMNVADTAVLHLRQQLEVAEQITARLVAAVNRHLDKPTRGTEERCSGGGSLPGALEWGKPDCDSIGSSRRFGLCDACYMRYYRWQQPSHTPDAA